MISQLVAKKSSSLSTLMQQSNSLQSSIAALKNQSTGGSINSSYSSQISSLQDAIDRLNTQYTINENKLSTVNSLNNSYKKTVSTLDDYINSLKNPTNVSETINASSSNSSVADVTLNGTADVQSHNLKVTQLATCSTLTSAKIKGGAVSGTTKIVDLFSGSYNSTTNTITSIRTDLRGDMKLSDVGITSGAFKLGSRVIRISEDETVDDLLAKINADSNYLAGIDENTGAFTIQGLNGSSIGITNAVGDLSVSGNIAMDTKLADIGIKTGAYFVGDAQIDVTAGDTVATLIDKIESTGYRAELVTDVSNPSGKVLSITDEGGNAVDASATNFASLAGFTVSDGTFSINGTEFNIDTNTTINDLVHSINAATTDNVGAEFKNGKIVLTASETGAIDISVEKGTSNFTNAIGFTQGGVMYTGNYVVGSEGSCATLTGVKNTVNSSDYAGGLTGTQTIKAEYMTLEEAQAQGYTIINTAEEFVNSINASPTDKFYLNADLTIDSSVHGSISSFSGTLEGNGHTITYTGDSALLGEASRSFDVVVRNLNIANSSVSSTDDAESMGLLFNASNASLTIDNVNIFDSTIDTNRSDVGALIGYVREGSVDISNVDIDGLTINASDARYYSYVGSLIGYVSSDVSALNINNVEALNLDINYTGTVSSSCVGGLIGRSSHTPVVKYVSDIYLQGSIDAGVGHGYALASMRGNATYFTNNVYLDFDEDLDITDSYDASMNPVSTSPTPSGLATIPNYGVKEEALTQVSAGTIEINGKTISISAGTIADAIDEINAQSDETGVEALVVGDKLQLKATTEGGKVSVGDCTSNLKTVAGLDGKSFSTGSFVLSYSKIDEYGNATSEMLSTEIIVEDGDTVDDIINKIKTQTSQTWTDSEGVEQTNYWQGQITDGKFQLIQSDKGAGFKINVVSGTSDFTSYVGLTTEVVHGNAISGTSTTYTGANGVDLSDAFIQGTFSITASKANDPSTTETVTINVDEGETLESVIEKINSSGLAITASLVEHTDGTQRLQLTHNNQGAGYKISANSGSSNFTEAVGFTSSVSIGVAGDGDNSSLTGVTSGLTLADTGYTEGSFIVKASKISSDGTVASSEMATVEINVTSDMTLEDVLNQISSATYVDENGDEVDLGLRASLNADGKIVIEQAYAGEGFDIEVVGGSTNFTESVGLTAQVNAGVTTLGQNAQLVGETSFTVTNKSEDGTTFDDNYSFSEGDFFITSSKYERSSSLFVMGTEFTTSKLTSPSTVVDDSAFIANAGSFDVTYSEVDANGNVTGNMLTTTIVVENTDTIEDIAQKITAQTTQNWTDAGGNAQSTCWSAELNNGQFVISCNQVGEDYKISVDNDTSGFLDCVGLGETAYDVTVDANTDIRTIIHVDEGDSLQDVVNKINSAELGITAYIDNNGKLALEAQCADPDFKFEVESATSDFLFRAGLTSEITTVAQIQYGTEEVQFSSLTGTNNIKAEYMTLEEAQAQGYTIINTAEEFVNSISASPAGKFYLNADLTIDASVHGIISGFVGQLEGNGHTITYTGSSALLGDAYIGSVVVRNLNIANSSVSSTPGVHFRGLLFNYSCASSLAIDNVNIVDSTINTNSNTSSVKVGALVGSVVNCAVSISNVDIDGLTIRTADSGESCFVGSLVGYLDCDDLNPLSIANVEALNLDIKYTGTVSSSCVGGLIGHVETGFSASFSDIYLQGSIDAGIGHGYALASMHGDEPSLTNNVYLDFDEDLDITYSYNASKNPVSTNFNSDDLKSSASGHMSLGVKNETITQITAGSFEINGVLMEFSAGDISDAIDVINSHSEETGVKAILVDGKLQLKATKTGSQTIYVDGGTSNFGEVTGLTTKAQGGGTALGTEAKLHSFTGSKNVVSEYMSVEEAQAQGYTIINTAEEFISKINASPSGKFYLNSDLTIDADIHGRIGANFAGTIEGNGHKITYTSELGGLFSVALDYASFNNLTLSGDVSKSSDMCGALVEYSMGPMYLRNVNTDALNVSGQSNVGLLVGSAETLHIINSDISNSSVSGTNAVGLVGTIAYEVNLADSYIGNDVNITASYGSGCVVGQTTSAGSAASITLTNTYLGADLSSSPDVTFAICGHLNKQVTTILNDSYINCKATGLYSSAYGSTCESNETYCNEDIDTNGSILSRHAVDGISVEAMYQQHCDSSKFVDEGLTYISAGTVVINGTTINLTQGSIISAIEQINAKTSQTGVTAQILDGKVKLSSLSAFSVQEGTSDFVEKTGTAGYTTTNVTESELISGLEGSCFSISAQIESAEQAEALGYTAVTTADELITALSEQKDIVLLNDIDFSGVSSSSITYHGILDGNGHMITNLSETLIDYTDGATTIKNLEFSDCNATSGSLIVGQHLSFTSSQALTFENIKITVSSLTTYVQYAGFLVRDSYGFTTFNDIVLSNCDLNHTGRSFIANEPETSLLPDVGLLGGSMGAGVSVDGVTVDSGSSISVGNLGYVGGLFGDVSDFYACSGLMSSIDNVSIEANISVDGQSTTDYKSPYSSYGGLVGLAENLLVKDSYVGTTFTENYSVQSKSIYVGSNNYTTTTISNSYHKDFVTGLSETISGSGIVASKPTSVTGGEFTRGAFKTKLTESQAIDKGYTVIKTASEFVEKITANTSGKFMLMNDIDLSGVTGLDTLTFKGELHGNGYTLRNYTSTNVGLFNTIDGATIKNLNIDNFETFGGTLAFGSKGNLDIENIKITNSAVDSGGSTAGALVGAYGMLTAGLATIDNVRVTDTTISGGHAGGLIGGINYNQANIRVTNSYIDAEVTGTTSVGGVVGTAYSDSQHYENIYIGGTLNLNGTTEQLSAVVGNVLGSTKAVYTSRLIIDATPMINGALVNATAITSNSCSGEIIAKNNICGSNWNVLYTGGSATTTVSSDSIQQVLASRKDIGVSVYRLLSEGTLTVKGAGGTSTINIKEGWNLQQLADAVNNSSSGVKIVVREGDEYSFECFSEINVSEENKDILFSTYMEGTDIKPVRYYSSVSGLSENSKIEGLTSGTFSIKVNIGEPAGGGSRILTVNIDETATIGQIIDDINDVIGVGCGLDADGRLYIDTNTAVRVISAGGSIEFLEGSSNFDSLFFKADTIQNTASSGTQAALLGSVNIDGTETLTAGEVVISAGNVSQSFTYNAGESVDDVIQKINNSSLGVTASIYNGKLLLVNNDMQDSDNISVEEVSGNFGAITGTTTITPQQGVSIVGHAGSATTLTGSKTINNIMTIDDAREAGFTIVENQTQLKNAISNNKDIYLACDIEITDASVLGLNYSGTFEGGGNTITSTIESSSGLFDELQDATIRNVNLTDFHILSAPPYTLIGVLSGLSYGNTVVENVRVSSSSISGEFYDAAGLIGANYGVLTVNNVKIDGVQFDCRADEVAGICSYLSGATLIVDNVDISCSASNSCVVDYGIGGVFGYAEYSEISVNNANIKLTSYGASDVYSLGYLSNSNLLADNIWIDNTYSANDKYLNFDTLGNSFNINNANVISDTPLAIDGFDCNAYSAIEFDLLNKDFYNPVVPQITAGTVNINGSDVTLSGGSLNEALYEINQQTATTGVRASIVNNKVVLENIEYNNNAISVTAGTSNFVAVTGVAGYEVPEAVIYDTPGGMVKGDNAIQGTHYTKEEAEAMGYVWVTSASQFSDFSYPGATNVKVMLGCDIDLSSFAGGSQGLNNVAIFDGNGYTIKNYTGTTSLFVNGYDSLHDLTVKNLKIDNFEVQSTATGPVGAFLDSTTKSIKFENVEVTNTSVDATQANSVGLLVGSVTGLNNDSPATVNFSNVLVKNSNIGFSQSGSRVGGLVGNITTNGIVSANNVLIDGFSIEGGNTYSEGAGSMFGYVNGTLMISASEVVNGSITLRDDSYGAGVIGRFDSTQNASYTYSSSQSCKLYNVRASVDFNESGGFPQVIYDSTGDVSTSEVFYNSDMATGAYEEGATSDFSTVWHTFDENWSAKGIAKTASQAVAEGYTCIYTADEFVSSINANKSGKFMLMNDIDLSDNYLYYGITDFAGILDGNGYTIKNYTSDGGGALFYSASGSVIFKNLTLDNFTIDKSSGVGRSYSAALLYDATNDSVLIENVTLQNSSIEASERAAGLVAYVSGSAVNVNNVNIADSVSITATSGASYVGGIVAYASSTAFLGFSNSESSANLTSGRYVGQVVGSCSSLTLIDNVKLAGTVSSANAASVAGRFQGDTTKIVKNSYMESTVDGTTTEGVFYASTDTKPFWSINCAYDSSNMSTLNTNETNAKLGDVSALTDTEFEAAVSSVTFKEDYYTMVSDSRIAVTAFDYLSTNSNYSRGIDIKAGSIQSAVDQINQSLQSCGVVKVTAYIDSNNKIAFATTDARAKGVTVSDLYGDFFDIAINDSRGSVNGDFASYKLGIQGLTLDTTLGDLSGDQFIEGYINETELYNASTTIGDIISVVDSEFCKMSLDSEGRVVIKGYSTQFINGFDEQLLTLLGYSGTVADNSVTDLGEEAVNSTLTGTKDVSLTDSVAVGDFRLNCAGEVTTYTVTEGMTVADVLNMINRDDPNLSVELIDNKVHFTDVNELYGRITIIDGTSNFAEMAGFTVGNSQANSTFIGNNNTAISQNTVSDAEGKFTTGTFCVNITDMDGNITTERFTVTESDTVDSILNKIRNSSLDVSVNVNGSGQVVIQRNDSTKAGVISFTKETSNFTNVIGFTQGGVQASEEGSTAKITSIESVNNKTFSEGNFVIDILDLDGNIVSSQIIDVAQTDTAQDVVNKINNLKMGVTAFVDANTNRFVLERNSNFGEGFIQIRKGTSDFTNVLGLTSGGACNADFKDGVTTSLSAKYSASGSQRFTEGDFVIKLTGENEAHISVDVTSTDSIYSIANKINDMDSGVHAYVDNNAKLVIVRDADSGIGGLEVISGTSSITDDLGFTSGGQELPGLSKNGSVSKIVSTLNYITVGDSYSAGDFYIQLLDKNGNSIDGGLITVNIAETNGVVDDIYQVIKTINDKDAGVTASLDSEGRLVIQKAQDADAGSFVILKGSSDFTDKFGITSGGATIGDTFVSGTDETQSVLTSNDLSSKLASDSSTLGTIGVTDGTFKVNGVNIAVRSTDTVSDLATRISAECSDMGITASYINGQLVIRNADPKTPLCVEKGSSNFTVVSGLTGEYQNSVDLDATVQGNYAKFTLDGETHEMALSLNENGENILYLDAEGNVVTSAEDATLTVNIKKTGSTVIEVGKQLLNDSVEKLQTFVNRFNSAMKASGNHILADDTAFRALLNKINNALTMRVGSYYDVASELEQIGISIGLNSDGTLQMSLSKSGGEYDYVNAFYQDSNKVMDLLIGDDSEPLDFAAAGVFTRLSSVLHEALEDTRSGYFKVTPRSIQAQQKALKNEITSLTFDLNELKTSVGGTGDAYGVGGNSMNDAYIALLEAQYQMLNQAISDLNSQYNSSLVRLILNQNNSSFNPMVS